MSGNNSRNSSKMGRQSGIAFPAKLFIPVMLPEGAVRAEDGSSLLS